MDGTTEEIQMTESERDHFRNLYKKQSLSQSKTNSEESETDFKPAEDTMMENIGESMDITEMEKGTHLNFVLFPGQNITPMLLFRTESSANANFTEIADIVDEKSEARPSMYHAITEAYQEEELPEEPSTEPKPNQISQDKENQIDDDYQDQRKFKKYIGTLRDEEHIIN